MSASRSPSASGARRWFVTRPGCIALWSVLIGVALLGVLSFTERPLKVVPTFASVAAWGSGPGDMELNRLMVVDGERDITFHTPMPVAANITADSSVLAVFDKGKDKGLVIRHQTVLKNEKGEASMRP